MRAQFKLKNGNLHIHVTVSSLFGKPTSFWERMSKRQIRNYIVISRKIDKWLDKLKN